MKFSKRTPEKTLEKMLSLRIDRVYKTLSRFRQNNDTKDFSCSDLEQLYHGDLRPMFGMILEIEELGQRDFKDISSMSKFLSGMVWVGSSGFKAPRGNIACVSTIGPAEPYTHKNNIPWQLNNVEAASMVEAQKVFLRPDVTPEIILKAWRLSSIGMIMEA